MFYGMTRKDALVAITRSYLMDVARLGYAALDVVLDVMMYVGWLAIYGAAHLVALLALLGRLWMAKGVPTVVSFRNGAISLLEKAASSLLTWGGRALIAAISLAARTAEAMAQAWAKMARIPGRMAMAFASLREALRGALVGLGYMAMLWLLLHGLGAFCVAKRAMVGVAAAWDFRQQLVDEWKVEEF